MSNQKANFPAVPESAGTNGGAAAATGAGRTGNGASYADRVDPEALLLTMSRSVFPRMIVISAIFHVLLIGLSSVSFIQLCVKYDSLHPRRVIKQLEKEEADKKAAADDEARVKAAQEAVKKKEQAKPAATPEKTAPATAAETPPAGTAPAGAPAGTAPAGTEPDKPKSKIEKELEKTSTERPTKPSVNLDNANDLE